MGDFTHRNADVFPLSLSQQNIWALERSYPETSINNISTTIRIQGRVDFVALRKSLLAVLAADPTLRTRITLRGKQPVQYCAEFSEESFPIFDFSQTSPEGIENWEQAVTREPMPLLDSPLYRFILFRSGEHSGGVLIKLHHIISDGWSQVLLCNRIGQTYLDLLTGRQPEAISFPEYRLHVQAEHDYLLSEAYERDRIYWESVLLNAGEPSVIKSVRSAALSPVGRRLSFDLPQIVNHDIYSFCNQYRISPFLVFYMALAIYFRRIGGAENFTIGVPVFNRSNYIFKQTTGMFVSTLPFTSELRDDWSLSQYSEVLAERWLELLRRARFPFTDIQRLAEKVGREPGRLFHIALSYQDSKILESRDAAVLFSGRWHYGGYQAEQLCIHLSNLENNSRYSVDYDYLTQLFSKSEIEAFHSCLINILHEALAAPDKPIHRLAVLSAAEREKVLYTFNHTSRPIYENDLWTHFAKTVSQHPSRAAIICGGRRTSYSALSALAEEVCASVLASCRERNALIAVLLPRREPLLASMLGILRAGDAFLLLSSDLPAKRIQNLLSKSGAAALITDRGTMHRIGLTEPGVPVIDWDSRTAGESSASVDISPDELAYVVYTSGSTGAPKGVEISRRSLMNLVLAMSPVYGNGAVLSLCNVGFDAFLLESIVALLNGRTIILPGEEDLESPKALAALINGFGVGFMSLTPSRLSALLREPAFLSAMGRIESIVCGGEAFPSELLQRLLLHTEARIYNQYGPSETTVGVSLKLLNNSQEITAGAPMQNCRLYVLDDWLNPLPVGVYGKLYVGGVCVGRGYRNDPELTAESFLDSPFELGERLYRTGDIACWTASGEIILAGREDRQVKLRGQRVEPQELATCLATYPRVREAAARVFEQNGQSILVGYYASDAAISEAELLAYCASNLPNYMVPAAIVRLDKLPLTRSGKVDESLLPPPERPVGGPSAPATALQSELLSIIREVLERSDMGVSDDYFLCGGNSLNAMEAIGLISERCGLSLRVADLYACRNVLRLAELLGDEVPNTQAPRRLSPAPQLPRYPLTPVQQGIYVQSLMDPGGLSYNMPGAFRLGFEPDIPRLRAAFERLITDDRIFHSSFVQEPDGVFVRPAAPEAFELPILTGEGLAEVQAAFVRPFDLSRAPLLRAALWREPSGSWILLLDMHHIIGDGLSTPLLLRRLDEAYRGAGYSANPLSFLDYAYDLIDGAGQQAGQLDYWVQKLAELPEALNLPGDFPRPHTFDFRGGSVRFTLDPALSRACDETCAAEGISSFMLFLSVFGLLLSKLSGKDDLCVGSPVSGRSAPELQDMCGPFINTLPLRLNPEPDCSVRAYWQAVREAVTGMIDHQHVTQEELISALHLPRSLSGNPLYQVMFSQRPVDTSTFTFDGKPLECIPLPTGTAKADLSLETAREGEIYSFQLDYAASLFLPETAEYFGRCFEAALRGMLSNPEGALGDVNTLSPRDRIALIDRPNHTVTPFVNLPIHRIIEEAAELEENAAAIIFHGKTTTRRELEERANELANLLVQAGVLPGSNVGIAMRRGVDIVAAMLAVLKAGCAYVPLLADFPEARLKYMLDIAQIETILCDRETLEKLPANLPAVPVLTDQTASRVFSDVPVLDTDLVNVLFTSGSTGRPKGVMLKHRGISNLLVSVRELMERAEGPILCSTSFIFDAFTCETLIPLAMGKPVVMADEEEMMLPWKLAELITRCGVEIIEFTPARLQMCLTNNAFFKAMASVRIVIICGEVLTQVLLNRVCEATDAIVFNGYGPTECTVYMTFAEVFKGKPITIGRPIKNGRIYVLDEQRKPVLPTACGELYLAGECLSAGYISRPDLTESAFVPDPFFPGELMYRTGDIGRLRLDGSYDFMGRRDAQVKLNGQRVELDEINGAVVGTGLAVQAATVPLRRPDGSMELFTFFVPAQGAGADSASLVSRLRETLPGYMIPSKLVPLDKMPYTATAKIDMQTLSRLAADGNNALLSPPGDIASEAAPALTKPASGNNTESAAERREPEPPTPPADTGAVSSPAHTPCEAAAGANVTAEELLDIWSRSLQRSGLRPDLSFFDQGGSSLAALNVLSQYHNRGYVLSLAQFYENPTAAGQAALLRRAAGAGEISDTTPKPYMAPSESTERAPADTSEPESVTLTGQAPVPQYEPRLKSFPRTVPPLPESGAQALDTVLLTGAAEFFGAHILRALLEAGASRVLCITRDGREESLFDELSWYFGSGWAADALERVELIRGDISQHLLGLTRPEYNAIAARIDAVWHCADLRQGEKIEDFLRINVTGTETVVALAMAANAQLHHMSAAVVAGERLLDNDLEALFTENDFDIGQNWHEDLYVQSKFLAEAAVLNGVQRGLPARIYRLGRLAGRASDGVFQRNREESAFYRLLRGIHTLGAIPRSLAAAPVEMTPVDLCAKAVVALRNSRMTVFHPLNDAPPTLEQIACAVTPALSVLPDEEFDRLLSSQAAEDRGELFSPLADFWNRFKTAPPRIALSCEQTAAELRRLGPGWDVPGPERLLRAFRFEKPQPSARKVG